MGVTTLALAAGGIVGGKLLNDTDNGVAQATGKVLMGAGLGLGIGALGGAAFGLTHGGIGLIPGLAWGRFSGGVAGAAAGAAAIGLTAITQ